MLILLYNCVLYKINVKLQTCSRTLGRKKRQSLQSISFFVEYRNEFKEKVLDILGARIKNSWQFTFGNIFDLIITEKVKNFQ